MKTQTRRFKKPRVKVGRTYKLQTQFYKKENLGRIRITGLCKKVLGNITPSDAKKLGYRSKSEYLAVLAKIRKEKLNLRRKVYVIDFVYCA